MTLRPYQQTALTDARQAYRDGARRVLMVAPTGAGKTVIAATAIAAAAAKGRSILVVAPRREIVAQTSAKLTAAGVRHGIIAAGQRNPWPNAPRPAGHGADRPQAPTDAGRSTNTHASRRRRSAP
jgi:DNA repair protein RadD